MCRKRASDSPHLHLPLRRLADMTAFDSKDQQMLQIPDSRVSSDLRPPVCAASTRNSVFCCSRIQIKLRQWKEEEDGQTPAESGVIYRRLKESRRKSGDFK